MKLILYSLIFKNKSISTAVCQRPSALILTIVDIHGQQLALCCWLRPSAFLPDILHPDRQLHAHSRTSRGQFAFHKAASRERQSLAAFCLSEVANSTGCLSANFGYSFFFPSSGKRRPISDGRASTKRTQIAAISPASAAPRTAQSAPACQTDILGSGCSLRPGGIVVVLSSPPLRQ